MAFIVKGLGVLFLLDKRRAAQWREMTGSALINGLECKQRGELAGRYGGVDSFFECGGIVLCPVLSPKLDTAATETNRSKRFALTGQILNLY